MNMKTNSFGIYVLFVELAEIKHELETTIGKEEFARQISRQRSHPSETQSTHSDTAETSRMLASPDRSLSR